MQTVEIQTEDLSHQALNWALAKSLYRGVEIYGTYNRISATLPDDSRQRIEHSDEHMWSKLLGKNMVISLKHEDDQWTSVGFVEAKPFIGHGETIGESVARCVVMMKIGLTVSVPAELVKNDEQ